MKMHPQESMLDNTNCEHVYDLLEEVFETCLQEADTSDLILNFSDLYDSFSGQGFEKSFDKILLHVLSESKRSTDVAKLLRFISESVVSLDNKYKSAETEEAPTEDIDDIVHPLLKYLFKTLIRWSEASSYVVRFRSCQLLYSILTYIQDHGMGEIDMETYENIGRLIELRRLDVSSNVRTHAVHLAKFFQDPSTVNDPVIAGLCWQMQHDPNPSVRQNIVSIIAACEETIMPIAKRFLYDQNASVRNAALLHICKRIGPRSFTPDQRILILQQCFTDPSDTIRRNAEQKLIPVWFRACGDKLCTFFKQLRIGSESLDNLPFIKELTKVLSKFVKVSQILDEIELDTTSYLPKLPLSGEKVFLWRNFFTFSNKDQRLSKFFPPLESLIPFILKCFDDSSYKEMETCVFSELILFLMDLMEAMGIKECDEVFPMALNLMRHPFMPYDLMPYLTALYLTYSPKEKEQVHNDILEVIEDLQKLMLFTQDQEVNILLKCFAIASQVLMDESSLTSNIKKIKDNLIIHHLSSEDPEVKKQAICALALYSLLDFKEAKLSWPFFENALHLDSGPLRKILLEGAFDILKCHGTKIFADLTSDGQEKFDETILAFLACFEDGEIEQDIVVGGILKLYIEHHTLSPSVLANVVVLIFYPNDYASAQYELEQFFPVFSETKEGSDCLVKTFLTVINLLFDADKKSILYKISIKTVAVKLLEFSKAFESQAGYTEEKFQDLLVVKLTKKFIKKPWRLSASDLYSVCGQIIPKKFETMLKLKENVLQIRENLQSSVFQQKNPYAKKNIKNFCTYQKKLQTAMNTAPLVEEPPKEVKSSLIQKRLDFSSSQSSSRDGSSPQEVNIEVDTSPLTERSSSEENIAHTSMKEIPPTPPEERTMHSICETPVPCEVLSPCTTPALRKIATASRTRSTRKTPARSARKDTTALDVSHLTPPEKRTMHSICETPVPCEEQSPYTTPAPRKIAIASRTRSARKTPAPSAQKDTTTLDVSSVFKTPRPRRTPARNR